MRDETSKVTPLLFFMWLTQKVLTEAAGGDDRRPRDREPGKVCRAPTNYRKGAARGSIAGRKETQLGDMISHLPNPKVQAGESRGRHPGAAGNSPR